MQKSSTKSATLLNSSALSTNRNPYPPSYNPKSNPQASHPQNTRPLASSRGSISTTRHWMTRPSTRLNEPSREDHNAKDPIRNAWDPQSSYRKSLLESERWIWRAGRTAGGSIWSVGECPSKCGRVCRIPR
jgi:hypothetical protein